MVRRGEFSRKTNETDIKLLIDLDGNRNININTGIGFFNHMLNLFAFHGKLDFNILAKGDLDVDDHHLIEDVGILIGKALKDLLGSKEGIKRYSSIYLPMDEALAFVVIDISDRPYLVFDGDFNSDRVGDFSTEMVEEFFKAIAFNAGITMHLKIMYGKNDHHKIEALFKGFGRAIKEAVALDADIKGVLSTKGVL